MNYGSLDLNAVWFILIGVLFTGYAMLDGFDLGVGALHLFTRNDEERRIADQRHRPGVGRQRSLAGHRRRRAVCGVPERLCHRVLRLLPRVCAAARRADLSRGGHRVPQQTANALVAADVGRRIQRGERPVQLAHRGGHGQHRLGHLPSTPTANSPAASWTLLRPLPAAAGRHHRGAVHDARRDLRRDENRRRRCTTNCAAGSTIASSSSSSATLSPPWRPCSMCRTWRRACAPTRGCSASPW